VGDPVRATLEAVWRLESAKLIAVLARIVRNVNLAEELAQEAFVAALEQWSGAGLPDNPAAWLTATARHRAIDVVRRERRGAELTEELSKDMVSRTEPDEGEPAAEDSLRVIFMACHPLLPAEARSALALRLLCGLTTAEIARAFLLPEATIAQRIVRAKNTLAEAGVTFEELSRAELRQRLPTVLEVVYLLFNEGYTATRGSDWMRADLCEEALRLGRVLAELQPREAEVHGLVALMEIQASRLSTRVDANGRPILLLDQDRGRWDYLLIRRGLAALERALATSPQRGSYTLQACIAACHARARTGAETDWRRIVEHYDELARLTGSPIVELNRAVAVAMADGPQAGLELVDALTGEPALAAYHLLPAVRGDLLARLGRHEEAREQFERAAALASNEREAELLRERARRR
jgi:RNA polymerase sigma factor (sigma-70 family)